MKCELEIITDILSQNIKPTIITKNDKVKKLFDLETIELEEYIDPKSGKHIKKYCTISKENIYYKVNKPYEDLKYIMTNNSYPITGFAEYLKKKK